MSNRRGIKVRPEQEKRVLELLREGRLSQDKIAREVGLHQSTVSAISIRNNVHRERSDLPLARPHMTAAEIRKRRLEELAAKAAEELENQKLRDAKPEGGTCGYDKACPFPAMIGGMCRRHYVDSRALFSTSPSPSGYTISEGAKFGF